VVGERAMYLVFDTETTGIPRNHDAPASDIGNWPRLVQIVWLIADAEGHELRRQAFIVRPEGFVIPDSAVRVHGIDTCQSWPAAPEGLPAGGALSGDLQLTY
jgi:DNA polymerase III epsilon subunit-like protein